MITVPIVNVTSAAPAASAKVDTPSSSDQSFGQVLSRQVNGSGSSDNSSASTGAAQSSGGGNTSTNSNNSNVSGNTGSSTTAAGTAKGKISSKTQQANTTDQAAAAAGAAGSAQILALVTNVQQSGSAGSTASGATSAIGALAASTATTAAAGTDAALNNLKTAIDTPAVAQTAADSTDAALAAATASVAPKVLANAKEMPLPAADTQTASAGNDLPSPVLANELPQAQTTPLASQLQQSALDLGATAEKNIQSGLSALDSNLAAATLKAEQTVPTATPVVAQPVTFDAQSLGNPAENKLTPQVGSPGWDQALGQKVVWMVAGGQQSASLTLNPPDLGPMQVVLNVSNAHASATFTAAQPEVRQALEAAMPRLREMLGSAGIQLGQATVNAGTQQQNSPMQREAQQTARSNASSDSTDLSIAPVARAARVSSGLGLVDTFA